MQDKSLYLGHNAMVPPFYHCLFCRCTTSFQTDKQTCFPALAASAFSEAHFCLLNPSAFLCAWALSCAYKHILG